MVYTIVIFQTCLTRHGNEKASSEDVPATSTLVGSIAVKTMNSTSLSEATSAEMFDVVNQSDDYSLLVHDGTYLLRTRL